jgi:hypothetical protein
MSLNIESASTMNILKVSTAILCLAAFLSGCASSEVALNTGSGRTPASRQREHGRSWMLREAKDEGLIYAVGGCGGTCILSYPGGKLVGSLDVGYYSPSAACSDADGNVFIAGDNSVVEYAHGGAEPIATLSLPGSLALGCAVDPKTGNLAVVFRGSGADVAVFSDAKGTPALYNSQLDSLYCGYDASGNLFVDGYNGQLAGFSELPIGSTEFTKLSISYDTPLPPGQVQWDGKYITYESTEKRQVAVTRLSVSGSYVTAVGTTHFDIQGWAYQSWISGNKIFIPYSMHGARANRIAVWNYPSGGSPAEKFAHFGDSKTMFLNGVTLSL